MLVKFTTQEEQDFKIEELKEHFDVGTASKACMLAVMSYKELHRRFLEISKESNDYLYRLGVIAESIEAKEVADYDIKECLKFK
ncbi:hypothetical protein [Colwellia sp. E2M01]|uniref:hypothetical protein n=1 Tax=Colwellia sp. E2M01 TaxID=2841561 RepID=UPI001C088113|nr:hypothetical protein [Colwellia sp. E2M01]MBU2871534.1 hypothetical protein [Colwellia sp. E2M01]